MGRTVIPMPEYVEKETLLRQAIEERRWTMHKVRERDFCSYGKRRETTCD